MGEGIDVGVGQ